MDPALITALITYGPLGIGVILLVYALINIYKKKESEAEAHRLVLENKNNAHAAAISAMTKEHNTEVAKLHVEYRKEIQELYDQQVSALQKIIETANKATEANSNYVEQLSEVIDRLVPLAKQAPVMQAPSGGGTQGPKTRK